MTDLGNRNVQEIEPGKFLPGGLEKDSFLNSLIGACIQGIG
jgi:hypothetical protein